MCVPGCASIGMSCMKRLKRVGQSTDPRGTPLGKRLCGWCAVVDSVCVSTCKEGRQPFIVVCIEVKSLAVLLDVYSGFHIS